MIDRLQRALEHIDDLSPEVQDDIAQLIEEQTASAGDELAASVPHDESSRLPRRIRVALAAIGSARDLQDDDEFAALDRIRHESIPTPPIALDDL
jgi:hypothetical protein